MLVALDFASMDHVLHVMSSASYSMEMPVGMEQLDVTQHLTFVVICMETVEAQQLQTHIVHALQGMCSTIINLHNIATFLLQNIHCSDNIELVLALHFAVVMISLVWHICEIQKAKGGWK